MIHSFLPNSVFVENDALIHLDTFTSIVTKKFMIWLFSRVRHYLTITLRNPVDKRGFFYLNNDFIKFFIPNSTSFINLLLLFFLGKIIKFVCIFYYCPFPIILYSYK